MKSLKLNDLSAYRKSFAISNDVWKIVIKWNTFAKNTIGGQFVRAVDSISANIAEGFGKYYVKDIIRHYRISRGSTMESLDWNEKARKRKLITEKEYDLLLNELIKLPREINQLIKFTKDKLNR